MPRFPMGMKGIYALKQIQHASGTGSASIETEAYYSCWTMG